MPSEREVKNKYGTEIKTISKARKSELEIILYNIGIKSDRKNNVSITYERAMKTIRLFERATNRLRDHYQEELIKTGYMNPQ